MDGDKNEDSEGKPEKEKRERGGDRKMCETLREEIALKTVAQSELNQRRPAVSSDSALPLNRTSSDGLIQPPQQKQRWTE